jgi:hypothetical protein
MSFLEVKEEIHKIFFFIFFGFGFKKIRVLIRIWVQEKPGSGYIKGRERYPPPCPPPTSKVV